MDNLKKISVTPEDHMEVVIALIKEYKVSGVAVVQNDKLIGVISAKDFLKKMVSSKYLNEPLGFVENYMTKNPISIKKGSSVHAIVDMFTNHDFHYFPVIDKNNKYIGTIYRIDLLDSLSQIPQTTW